MVIFKSIPFMYEKEKSGVKPNTIRKIDFTDERWAVLVEHMLGHLKEGHIYIKNSETGEVFNRPITDVSMWEGYFIISWKHDSQGVK